MAFEEEEEAFRRFAELYGKRAVILVDTYDSLEAVKKALRVGLPFLGVRLDSGDFLAHSKEVRKLLDAGGRPAAKILVSGDLNEHVIQRLLEQGAPVDLFGVGTDLVTSRDAPALSGIYKLVEIASGGQVRYTAKFSESKVTYPGKKQIFRFSDRDEQYERDVLGLASESFPGAEPLLQPVMEQGKLVRPLPSLEQIQKRTAANLARLPENYRRLQGSDIYPVAISDPLQSLLETLRSRYLLLPAAASPPAKSR
jgi:nicotinate phosphoribosyltransferase